jgi:hypothetical protein
MEDGGYFLVDTDYEQVIGYIDGRETTNIISVEWTTNSCFIWLTENSLEKY